MIDTNNKLDSSSKQEDEKKEIKNPIALPTYIMALGGLGEVGKNLYVIEEGNELWIIDSGVKFSDDPNLNIEGIIPDFSYLERNQKKIRGLIVTHGHEDHIGSIPHLISRVKIPKIYGAKITLELIKAKIFEKNVSKVPMQIINNKYKIRSRNFEIGFFNTNHSIPDSLGLYFKSKNGVIVTTGDFKFDLTPIGKRTDYNKITQLGKDGVTLLMSDSTNALVNKFSESENEVYEALDRTISKYKNQRLILSTFASNVYRVESAIEIAKRNNRKIAIFGWSMKKVTKIARKIKYIDLDESLIIDEKDIKNYKDSEVLILCTGSQGEPNAALNKIALGKQKGIKVTKNDVFIFTSSPIPGNYRRVEDVQNKILRKGATIIDNKNTENLHTSGHGSIKENELMLSLVRPRYFMPIHGEYRMLEGHKKSALKLGMSSKNIFIMSNGSRIKLLNGNLMNFKPVSGEDVFVDGSDLLGQSAKVLADRKIMGGNGYVTTTVALEENKNEIIGKPEIRMTGVIMNRTNKTFISELEKKISSEIVDYFNSGEKVTFSNIKTIIRETTEKEIYSFSHLSPIVLPVVLKKDTSFNLQEEN